MFLLITFWEPRGHRAPGSQPDDTGPATAADHCGGMVNGAAKKGKAKEEKTNPVAPLKPAREVGWIFKNGEVVAIERRECEARSEDEVC